MSALSEAPDRNCSGKVEKLSSASPLDALLQFWPFEEDELEYKHIDGATKPASTFPSPRDLKRESQ
jgi:hypothetical protein